MKNLTKGRILPGFTLIELLVVIAIIGILSSVILASLNAARNKGSNAGVRTALGSLRSQANLYYNDNNNYGTANAVNNCAAANTMFTLDTHFAAIIASLQNASGFAPVCNETTASGGAWAISTQLKVADTGTTNTYLCTDANGVIKGYTSSPGTVTVCP